MRRPIQILGLLFALFACAAAADPSPPVPARLLFIGNSLTYSNDVPRQVAAILRQYGDTAAEVATVAFPNFSLEDHFNEGTAPARLRAERWDYVVMQQGPSSLPENQRYLATWARAFAPLIRAAGATPVLYQVWPSLQRAGDIAAVDQSYRSAADSVAGIYAPAGNAWYRLLDTDPALGLRLYDADGFHPGPPGAYLAALVIASRLTGRDPASLPPVAPGLDLDAPTVRALQRAASWALAHSPTRP